MPLKKDIKSILLSATGQVVGTIFIAILAFIFSILFGFDWLRLFGIIWNHEVKFIYILVLIATLVLFHFSRISSIKRKYARKFDGQKPLVSIDEIGPIKQPVQESKWFEVDKFLYRGVYWKIGVYSEDSDTNKKNVFKKFPEDEFYIKPEPYCPKCGTTLEDNPIIIGSKGRIWSCLNEKCDFSKESDEYFRTAGKRALKVWKSQNSSKFQ